MMRSVLETKEDVIARARMLWTQYRESFATINEAVENVEKHMALLDASILSEGDVDLGNVKELLSELNTDQTTLVNVLKRMSEVHAKMGYVIK